jgi:hypothetical protein
MPLPNFLIIGVPKAGTTSLWKYLRQHPSVYLPDLKEPRFFIDIPESSLRHKEVSTIEAYRDLFDGVESESAIGEASAGYFSHVKNPACIKSVLGNPKLILVLRNPIERAYSHFLFSKQKGLEPRSATFQSAIEESTVQIGEHTRHRPYVEIGFYYRHLKRWASVFGRERIKVLFFDDLEDDSIDFAQRVYGYLDVDPEFEPEILARRAKSGVPKYRAFYRLVAESGPVKDAAKRWMPEEATECLRDWVEPFRVKLKNWSLEKPKISKKAFDQLAERYRRDIRHLENEVSRDLTGWLEYSGSISG